MIMTNNGVKISRLNIVFKTKKRPVPITIGEVAKIKILNISKYLEEEVKFIKKLVSDNARHTPKNPENTAKTTEFKAAKNIVLGK